MWSIHMYVSRKLLQYRALVPPFLKTTLVRFHNDALIEYKHTLEVKPATVPPLICFPRAGVIMLAAKRASSVVAASTEKPPTPQSSSQKALGETITISVEEAVAPEDLPPDGGLRAWLVVFGVRSRIWILHCMLSSLLSIGCMRDGRHNWDS